MDCGKSARGSDLRHSLFFIFLPKAMRNASSQVLLLNLSKWHFILMTFCGFSQEAVLQGLANTSKLSQLGAAALWGSRLALSGMFLCACRATLFTKPGSSPLPVKALFPFEASEPYRFPQLRWYISLDHLAGFESHFFVGIVYI